MTEPARPSLLVLGMGRSGLALARWGARQGYAVTVADTRDDQALPKSDALRLPEAQVVVGPFDQALWQRAPWARCGAALGPEPRKPNTPLNRPPPLPVCRAG